MSPINRRVSKAARVKQAPQRGVVLIVALIVLVAMTLAGLALLRQMGIGTSIAGNVAFKESAIAAADRGIEAGRAWIGANQAMLNDDHIIDHLGYHATWGNSVDPTTYDWENESKDVTGPDDDVAATGNSARYIIHRLCESTGPSNGVTQHCSDELADVAGASKDGCGYGPCGAAFTPPAIPFYRITARVVGPRHTYSYVEVILR